MHYTDKRMLCPGPNPNPEHWHKVRKEVLERDGYACRLCSATSKDGFQLEVHHRFYIDENGESIYGCEKPEHLTTLCKTCHDNVTSMIRESRYGERAYPDSFNISIVLPRKAMSDVSRSEDEMDGNLSSNLPQRAASRSLKFLVEKAEENHSKKAQDGCRLRRDVTNRVFRRSVSS